MKTAPTKVEIIRALMAAGFPLIPLIGKRPFEENWEATPQGKHDEKTLAKSNYGVVLGARDLVIDVDPRNYANPGDKPLARLIQKIGVSFDTFVVRTGGGGLHIYLKKPVDLAVRNSLPEFQGIEFKAGPGRQVVGPGSIHPESKVEYTVAQGTPDKIPEAVAGLCALIKKKSVVASFSGGNRGTEGYKDDESTTNRYIDYLESRAPVSVEGRAGDDTAFVVACKGRDLGLSPDITFTLLAQHWNRRCTPPWEEVDLKAKVAHAYLYARGALGSDHPAAHFENIETGSAEDEEDREIGRAGWKLDHKKQPIRCFQNLLNYLGLSKVKVRGIFGYNEFARRVEFLGKAPWQNKIGAPIQDVDLQQLRAHLARQHAVETTKDDLVDAMVSISQRKRFHPVRDYLNALTWDEKPRLDTWLTDYLGVEDEPYVRAVARKTLCGAVARVYEPGIKFDHILVLEGAQGVGKSGVCRILGGEWSADFRLSVENKDTIQMMQGKWIVEMAELHTLRQTDADAMKAFLTRQVDEARFAYGRLSGEYPRQTIFIATYNPGADGTYLKDDTGNRRWWPVRCNGVPPGNRYFDFVGLKENRDQIFAEAVIRYKEGEALTMDTPALQEAATIAQAARHGEHPWMERIALWLDERDKNEETVSGFYTGREIYVGAMQGLDARFGRREAVDVARAMHELKWTPGFRQKGRDRTARGYWRPAFTFNGNGNGAKSVVEEEEKIAIDIFGDLL